jgi:hypothetical protein
MEKLWRNCMCFAKLPNEASNRRQEGEKLVLWDC